MNSVLNFGKMPWRLTLFEKWNEWSVLILKITQRRLGTEVMPETKPLLYFPT